MTREELAVLNMGQNLDHLMTLDPRGYGVSRILYAAARDYTGAPLTMNAANQLIKTVKSGDIVYILTGFVLPPFGKAEMDGIVSSVLLCRSLVKAFGAKPVIVCPEDNVKAVENLAYVAGLHLYQDLDELMEYPISMGVVPFTKDSVEAPRQARQMTESRMPRAVISIEAPGANAKGIYHNSAGLDVSAMEAKLDVLFSYLRDAGVLNIAIGDLGNEIGMAALRAHIHRYIPRADGGCACPCGGGIAAESRADHIITATVSDWGAYGLMAALAYLKEDAGIFHTREMEQDALVTAAKSGMIDMYGWLVPDIDGIRSSISLSIVELMRDCVDSSLKLREKCAPWFDQVLERGFFEGRAASCV